MLPLHVVPADKYDHLQVRRTAKAVQKETGRSVEPLYVDHGYTGDQAQDDAVGDGVILHAVKLSEAQRSFLMLSRRWVVERNFACVTRFRELAKDFAWRPKEVAELPFAVVACITLARCFVMRTQHALAAAVGDMAELGAFSSSARAPRSLRRQNRLVSWSLRGALPRAPEAQTGVSGTGTAY
jgi:transposase